MPSTTINFPFVVFGFNTGCSPYQKIALTARENEEQNRTARSHPAQIPVTLIIIK
jgi:hypothetical protein